MNKIKLGIVSFIIGEVCVLFHKDKTFKDRFKASPGIDGKAKLLFNELVELNKKIYNDVVNYNYTDKIDDLNKYFDENMGKINDMISNLKGKWNEMNESQIQPAIQKIEEEIISLRKNLETGVQDLNERLKLQERVNYLTEKVNQLKERFNKKDENKKKEEETDNDL